MVLIFISNFIHKVADSPILADWSLIPQNGFGYGRCVKCRKTRSCYITRLGDTSRSTVPSYPYSYSPIAELWQNLPDIGLHVLSEF